MEAFIGIIGGYKNNDTDPASLTFWGTRYDSMNDPQDYVFATKVVLPKIQKAIENMDNLKEEETENVESHPFIVSFSEMRDNEFMWAQFFGYFDGATTISESCGGGGGNNELPKKKDNEDELFFALRCHQMAKTMHAPKYRLRR